MRRKVPLVLLGGAAGGVPIGLAYSAFFLFLGLRASGGRWFLFVSVLLGVASSWVSTQSGRWLSGLNGPILWLAALAGAAIAVEVMWLTEVVDFGALTLPGSFNLGVSLVGFVLATGFFARPPDRLFP